MAEEMNNRPRKCLRYNTLTKSLKATLGVALETRIQGRRETLTVCYNTATDLNQSCGAGSSFAGQVCLHLICEKRVR
jgi:hypothetical protein